MEGLVTNTAGKEKEKKPEKNSVITLGIVLIISTWLLPGFGNLFSCCWPIRVDFFAFNDFLWELMSDAAERRPNKKAERPFVVPEVIKPNHRAPWFAPCVFFHVCVCVQGCVCIHESKREREREKHRAIYSLRGGCRLCSDESEWMHSFYTDTHSPLSSTQTHAVDVQYTHTEVTDLWGICRVAATVWKHVSSVCSRQRVGGPCQHLPLLAAG